MSHAAEPIGPKRYRRGRPWSPEKHGLIQYYLGGTGHKAGGFMKATQNAGGSYYIDLFSGPGQVEMEDGQIIDGSPLIAARASPPFARLFWVDADPSNAASLRAHRQDFPNRAIDVFEADANEVINMILDGVPVTQPALAFLDPEGSELHWETIRRIAFHKPPPRNKIEQFILVPTDTGIVRFFPRDPAKMAHADRLDRMLPDPAAWRDLYSLRSKLDGPEFRRRLVGLYVDGLRGLGVPVCSRPTSRLPAWWSPVVFHGVCHWPPSRRNYYAVSSWEGRDDDAPAQLVALQPALLTDSAEAMRRPRLTEQQKWEVQGCRLPLDWLPPTRLRPTAPIPAARTAT